MMGMIIVVAVPEVANKELPRVTHSSASPSSRVSQKRVLRQSEVRSTSDFFRVLPLRQNESDDV